MHPDLEGEIVLLFAGPGDARASAGADAPVFEVAAFDADAGKLRARVHGMPGPSWSTPATLGPDGAVAARGSLPLALLIA
jgi:hypothetical protein